MDTSFTQELVSTESQLLEIDELEFGDEDQTLEKKHASEHLDDYLDSLTCSPSTSINLKLMTSSRHSEPSRRSSVPAIQNANDQELRSRNPSSSSDNVSRTRGSTFLDSYLGQLTDNSWLIHPIGGKKRAEKNGNIKQDSESKVSFINVEAFYDRSPPGSEFNKRAVTGKHDHNSDSQSNTEDSPSISSSIFDHESHETSMNKGKDSLINIFHNKNISHKDCFTQSHSHPIVTEATSGLGDTLDDSDPLATEQSADSISTDTSLEDTGHSSLCVSLQATRPQASNKTQTPNTGQPATKVDLNRVEGLEICAPSMSENSTVTELTTIVSLPNNETESLTEKQPETPIDTDSCDSSPKKKKNIPQDTGNTSQTLPSMLSPQINVHESVYSAQADDLKKSIAALRARHSLELEHLLQRQHEELRAIIVQNQELMYPSTESNVQPGTSSARVSNYSPHQRSSDQTQGSCAPQSSDDNFSETISHSVPKDPFFLHKTPDSADSHNDQSNTTPHQISRLFRAEKSSKVDAQHVPNSSDPRNVPISVTKSERDGETNQEMDASELLCTTQPTEFRKKFEFGLDLIPAREKDLDLIHDFQLTPSQFDGICKLQAIVRGQRIRRMMATSPVQQILATLGEVAKLARQFHKDILTDSIRKGDVDFHRALFTQEKQAREKLWHLLVEISPVEQTKIIAKDREIRKKSQARKMEAARSPFNQTVPRFIAKESNNESRNVTKSPSMHQIRRPNIQQFSVAPRIQPTTRKPAVNKIPRRSPSEPYRLCQSQKHSRLPLSKPDSSPEKPKNSGTPRRGIPKSVSHSDKIRSMNEGAGKSQVLDNSLRNVRFATVTGKENSEKNQSTPRKPNQKFLNKPKPQWR